MAYLIYTDRKNLLKTIQSGKIRIPRNLCSHFKLHIINKGDLIFLLDYEDEKVYGPVFMGMKGVIEERGPKEGPFNGFGTVEKHYLYESILVDCSKIFKKGVSLNNTSTLLHGIKFALDPEEELNFLERIELENQVSVPIVINLSLNTNEIKATIVELEKQTSITNHSIPINENFFLLIKRKKRIAESLLKSGRDLEFVVTLKEIGKLIYENFFMNLNLDRVLSKGKHTIHITGDALVKEIPIEITFKNGFIFENNVITYRGEEGNGDIDRVKVKSILILADPTEKLRWACQEGERLYSFFEDMDISVDFVSRPIGKELLIDIFPEYDIIHFSGHSEIKDLSMGWDIGLSLFSTQDLLDLTHLPYLVFSSSCGDTLNFGMELLRSGVRNVVSSRWNILDRDITEFLTSFYSLLFQKVEIGKAFNRSIYKYYERGQVIPSLFVLQGESKLIYEKQSR